MPVKTPKMAKWAMTLVKALTQPYQFINNNHAANQQANKNSNFDEHVVNEKGLGNAGKGTSTVKGNDILPNYKVSDLSKIDDKPLNVSEIRGQLGAYVKGNKVDNISIPQVPLL